MGGVGADAEPGSASRFSTLQNLVKPFIGAGILALPSAFKEGGVLASAILMVILAAGTNYCIRALLHCVDFVYAREHGLEYDEQSGTFSRALPDENPDERSGRGSVNGSGRRKGVGIGPAADGGDHGSSDLLPSDDSMSDPSSFLSSSDVSSSIPLSASPGAKVPPQIVVASVVPQPGTPATPAGVRMDRARIDAEIAGMSPNSIAHITPPVYSYRDIGGFAWGQSGTLIVDVNLVASQLGFCIAYMSFISQNMDKVVESVTRVEWIGLLFIGWAVLTQVRKIQTIAFTSLLGNFVYIVSLSIIFYDGFSNACCVSVSDTVWLRPQGLALVFGTGCFALEGIGLVLPVKRAMEDQSAFSKVLNIAITIVACFYVVFGVLGYLFYGDAVKSVITDNLSEGALADGVRVSLSISLFFTYAIQMFPVTEITDGLWDRHVFFKKPSADGEVMLRGGEGDKYQSLRDDGSLSREGEREDEAAALPKPVSYETFPPSASAAAASPSAIGSPSGSSSIRARPASPSNNGHSVARSGGFNTGSGAVHHAVPGSSDDPVWPSTRSGSLNFRREAAFILTRVALVAFTAGVSIAFPNFGLIVSLVGSFSNSAIAFILPQLFYIKLVLQHPERSERAWANAASDKWWTRNKDMMLPCIIVVLGICASIVGVTTTIQEMVEGDHE